MTPTIQQTAERIRRNQVQRRRVAIRSGAQAYAESNETRARMLKRINGARVNDARLVPYLKGYVRSQKQMQAQGHWGYKTGGLIAALQCLGGEMMREKANG